MAKSPEVEHLQRAVDAVKKGLLPEVQKKAESESDQEPEEEVDKAGKKDL